MSRCGSVATSSISLRCRAVISVDRDGAFVDVCLQRGLGNVSARITLNEAINLYEQLHAMLNPPPPVIEEEPDA